MLKKHLSYVFFEILMNTGSIKRMCPNVKWANKYFETYWLFEAISGVKGFE